ncbi:crossover junction endonuclease MUS81 [Quillaja saponaria]|uniref:Crossover junction endonuclease MUS81 n=1 Tax=Quillaja saponaria TaxID=32244 RepID=A0AAD7QJ21_QUISA|nr:crossover junction endonuclease MUS81 [Quillaja saponaria]
MENPIRVRCPENEELAAHMLKKRLEMAEKPKGISEKIDMTLSKAYTNVCNSKTPIKTIKDFVEIKGVGKWILKLMKEFFESTSGDSEPQGVTKKGTKGRGTTRYVPQKNSVAYALLITLFRGTSNGNEFMHKQELIDAAEASGLSRAPVAPELGKGKQGHFGSSPRDWYSGWNCMKTLIIKGLVVKSSCPAKYMLTQEGKEAAGECLMRSGLADPKEDLDDVENLSDLDKQPMSEVETSDHYLDKGVTSQLSQQKKLIEVPLDSLEKFTRMGYSKEQVLCAFTEVSESSQNKDISSLWPAVLCHLREDQVYGLQSCSETISKHSCATTTTFPVPIGSLDPVRTESWPADSYFHGRHIQKSYNPDVMRHSSSSLRACSSSKSTTDGHGCDVNINSLSMPPLSFGERFEDAYEVILILDNREQFATQGSRSRRFIENVCSQYKIQIEVRRLPVGDGIWIARHKTLSSEYVLDFIVERKKVDDLRCSIKDNRYKDQKLRLLRCGLRKLIYLVEGDPNASEAAESIKTACLTTEILEGFDVQRTNGLADTLKKYGYLTQAIIQYYKSRPEDHPKHTVICPSFDEFIKRCQDLDKMTVSDVFAIQLMQVPQVTEEVAMAVLDLYPTLLSLARAYSLLEGDTSSQEKMLSKESNNLIKAAASKNIFRFVWGN